MRVTALYNPEAGAQSVTRQRLRALLERAGFGATYHSTKADGWKDVLDDPGDLVVVAGGDGTTAKVAKRLAGRGIPLAILPAGTANNVARSLGLDAPLQTLVARWAEATPTPVDLGMARGPWGEELFIEACGLGVFPRMLEIAAAREKMTPAERRMSGQSKKGIELMMDLVESSAARHWSVSLDGRDLSGEYIMLEAMNIRHIGSGMELAPNADVSDGELDVVAVRTEDRESFLEHARGLGPGAPLPRFMHRGKHLDIAYTETLAHIDDEPWPERDTDDDKTGDLMRDAAITISIQPGAIEVLL